MRDLFYICGKETGQKNYKAIDLDNGCFTNRLIFASMLERDEAERAIASLTKSNPNINFILKRVK